MISAPAKINLALHVTGRRPDGYHLLESLVAFSRAGDRLRLEKADRDSFSIDGPFAAALAAEGDNLVLRARDRLRAASGGRIGPVAIRLTKNLPVAAGLGGGSSDAAAVLAGLHALMAAGAGMEELMQHARPLGADVPMCLAGIGHASALLARGIGEKVELLPDFPALSLVLLMPEVAVATPVVFAALESRQNRSLVLEKHGFDSGRAASFDSLVDKLEKTRNDLYHPARQIAPQIDEALDILRANGAAFARMSGSGAACFGLYRSMEAAQAAARRIARSHPGYFVLATATYGKKPDE